MTSQTSTPSIHSASFPWYPSAMLLHTLACKKWMGNWKCICRLVVSIKKAVPKRFFVLFQFFFCLACGVNHLKLCKWKTLVFFYWQILLVCIVSFFFIIRGVCVLSSEFIFNQDIITLYGRSSKCLNIPAYLQRLLFKV